MIPRRGGGKKKLLKCTIYTPGVIRSLNRKLPFALYRPKSDLSYLLQKHNYLVFHRHQFYISIIFLSWMNFCHVIALEGDISINKTICEWKTEVIYVTISLLFYFQISLINIWHHICCIVVGGPGVARICVGRIFELIIIYFFKNDFSYNN